MVPMEIKETMPLQEIAEKIAAPDESPARAIMEQLNHKYFDPNEFEAVSAWQNIDKEDRQKFFNTLRSISLADMFRATDKRTSGRVNPHLKEFLASSGSTGIAGAYYLIPVKIYDQMQTEAVTTDKVAALSKAVLGAEGVPGTTMKVDIAKDGSYIFNETSSGAIAPTETIETVQATLDLTPIYAINFRIGNDLIEDSKFDLISLHVSEAGRQAGEKATDLAFTVLYTATDGDGTNNQITSDQAYTEWASDGSHTIEDAINLNIIDGYVPDTLAMTHAAFLYNIKGTAGIAYNEAAVNNSWITGGYPTQLGGMNIVWVDTDYAVNTITHRAAVFTKEFALLSARKRWLRVENYSEPVKDLTGAVISFRQDSVTLYDDSIAPYIEGS